MSYLLLPPDEAALVQYLCDELGLALLLSDITDGGVPRVAPRPLAAIPDGLPWKPQPQVLGQPAPGGSESLSFTFWCRALGPVRTFADAPPSREASDRVAALLTGEAAGGDYADIIDMTRTPVIRWQRACFQSERRLLPGLLQAMPLKPADQPPEVLRLHRQIERWLKSRGEKLNPFDHCREPAVAQPRNLNPFWVWVHPAAMQWVRDGGEIWPWTA